MASFSHLNNEEFRQELINNGIQCGPIGATTRSLYEKKLLKKLSEGKKKQSNESVPSKEQSIDAKNTTLSSTGSSSSSSKNRQPSPPLFPSPRSPLRMFGDSSIGSNDSKPKTFSESIFDRPISKTSTITSTTIRSKFPDNKRISGSSFLDKSSGSFARHNLDDGEEEDDHTESSRIISPKFQSSRTSYGGGNSNVGRKSISPINKAWGFFSRSLGSSTPCSDFNYYNNNKYTNNKYKKNTYSETFTGKISDNSHWIRLIIIAFVVGIFAIYIYKAHAGIVYSTFEVVSGFLVAFVGYTFYPLVGLFIVAALFLSIYKLFQYLKHRNIKKKQTLIQLVERITDIIYDSGLAGIAEPHVRDMLMPPTKRTSDEYKLWCEAARFINNEDSRVRTEIRLINGTECNVWIWIGAQKQRWQGTALAEDSPSSRFPDSALSSCIKLRGLNFSDNKVERDSLRKELLAKLSVVPKHLDFVNNPITHESVVYLMFKNLADAKKAFSVLHSQWFDGNIITVKYVRDDRYAERFPGLK